MAETKASNKEGWKRELGNRKKTHKKEVSRTYWNTKCIIEDKKKKFKRKKRTPKRKKYIFSFCSLPREYEE